MGFEFFLPCSWKRQLKTVTKVKFYRHEYLAWGFWCLIFISNHLFLCAYLFLFQNCVQFHTTRYQRLWYNDCTVVTAAMSACILAQKRYCPSLNTLWGHFCDNHPKARQTMDFCVKNVALMLANSKQSGSVTEDVWLASKWRSTCKWKMWIGEVISLSKCTFAIWHL